MSLDQFKQWALSQGTVGNPTADPNNQFTGECASLVQQYLNKVYGIAWVPRGDAKDWPTNGNVLSYFDKVSSPQAGDIGVSGAVTGNPYGHIWIYLNPNTILEQNGSVSRRVGTRVAYANPIAILRRKGTTGGNGVIIGNGENWYGRLNKLHQQVRGRDLDRASFNNFVGQDTLKYIEVLSDDPEADAAQNWQNVGRVAVQDNWQGQIYALQDQLKVTTATIKSLQDGDIIDKKTIADLQKKVDELTKNNPADGFTDQDRATANETNNIIKQLFQKISNIFK